MKTKLLLLLFLANFSIYAQTNLVPNGGFENWTGGTPDNWAISNTVASSPDAATGQYSAKLSFTTASAKIIAQVPMKAGITYTVKYKYKYLSSNYGGDHPISLKISKDGSATSMSGSSFASNNSWTQKETTFTPDSDLSYDLSISMFSFDSAVFDILIDDVEVYTDAVPEKYTQIPDLAFENKLISLGIDSGAPDGQVLTSKVASLTSLNVSNSSITNLTGIEDFIALDYLYCYDNRLTQLNISKNSKLTILSCGNNLLTTLNLANNPLLITLQCANNKLAALDLSNNTALKTIDCNHNELTSIDVSKQLMLESLNCTHNSLKTLELFSNLKLDLLWCSNNLLKSLDLSKNNKLTVMTAHTNLLTYLNIQNGANYLFNPNANYATFYGNYLECIQVDNVEDANKRWSQVKDPMASFSTDCKAYTLIPDVNFEKKLYALGIDRDGINGKVLTSNISSLTTLNIYASSIADLTGIQDFIALKSLDCSDNQITTLDLSKNTKLTSLRCNQNKLTALDVSNNLDLQDLTLSYNKLTTIDISKNLALTTLWAYNNNFTNLDVSSNLALKYLYCNENQITTINLSKNIALNSLSISSNQLTNLDLSANINLNTLACDRNLLTGLDLKKNTALTLLNCIYNKLTCILVADVDYAFKNWSITRDKTASLTTDCNATTSIPDVNFETKLISLGIDSGTPDGKVLTINIAPLTSLDVTDSSIKDLTGIEAFRELTVLTASKNQLTTLNLSSNKSLFSVNLRENKLKNINIQSNVSLRGLGVSKNELTTLDVSQNINLTSLNADNNQLTSLDLSKNLQLNNAVVFNNQLTTLDLSKNNALVFVLCSGNKLTSLNLKNAPNLTNLSCHENLLTSLDVSANINLTDFTCYRNALTSLDVTKNTKLGFIDCSYNKITALDISKNINLYTFYSDTNQLTSLDVSKNTLLNNLSIADNSLTTIDVSKNTELNIFYCYSNSLTSVDISNNTKITRLQVDLNKLTSLNLKNGNNTIFDRKYTNFNNNPNLTCIIVDDVAYSNANWKNLKDATAFYAANSNCTLGLETSIFDKVAVYPNPTKGVLNIQNVSLEKADVYNVLGQLVKSVKLNSGNTDNTINLSGLPKGVYYVYLINQDAASAKKVILE
ncbi:T9SS type A sorting domain-containing protein [Flavobacterium sp. UBA7680]|uniref:T9SS type A sorting domain-containing protein n=1 Tax=Flavobacterium sp. UBA7680 TaxID=1946559 RepID=UPI0025C3E76A|nr:T9SS type A sorting domain-containing protein [Flavobacterium sp. UBA7680]